jgi:cytochrome c55X
MNPMKFFKIAFAAAAAFLLPSALGTVSAEEPVDVATSQSESKTDADLARQGLQLYAHHCSHCHGINMVNAGNIAFDLRTFPHNDKNRFVNSVTSGKNNRMPPWGDLLSKDDIDCLWAYVSSYKQP